MKAVFTGKSPFDESLTAKILQVYAIKGDSAYVLTFTAIPESYSTYTPTFESMIQSFKVND